MNDKPTQKRRPRTKVAPPNPAGLCQCGCGARTPLATITDARTGKLMGHPTRFLQGHNPRVRARITERDYTVVDRGFTTPCWIWNSCRGNFGYSYATVLGKRSVAHRAMYEQEVGPVPKGLTLDHLCRVRSCVNPAHLEPVSYAENSQRGVAAKLTPDEARQIRRSTVQTRDLAALYGVSGSTIRAIRAGRAWKNV